MPVARRGFPHRLFALNTALIVALSFASKASLANEPIEQLTAIEKELKKAESKQSAIDSARRETMREIRAAQRRLTVLAADLKKRQAGLSEAERQQTKISARLAELRKDLKKRADAAEDLTKALVRLGLKNPQLTHLNVVQANRGVRSIAALGATGRQIRKQTEGLRLKLDEVAAAMEELKESRQRKQKAQAALSADRRRLQSMLERKKQLKRSIDKDFAATKERIDKLAAKAAGLRDLIASLEKGKPMVGGSPRKNLLLPAEGYLAADFGRSLKGIKIAAMAKSRVIAPWGGKVLFAGRFRDYGKMVIISHGGDFHSIISGLGRVDVSPGSMLIRGEPIGAVGTAPLYFEWRRRGSPMNPLPWLAEKPRKKG